MDHQVRKQFPQFKPDWSKLGYDDSPQPPNLIGKIHPMYRIQAFTGTKDQYDMILPAIRLASNYLYSPKSCLFVYSLVYGKRFSVPSKMNYGGQAIKVGDKRFKVGGSPCVQFERMDEKLVSTEQMSHIWRQMSLHCKFGPRAITGAEAYCYPITDKDGGDLWGNGSHGYGSRIDFNSKYLDEIDTLKTTGKSLSLEMLNVQFHLALTLFHEVGHVAGNATDLNWHRQKVSARLHKQPAPKKLEPFLDGQETAELGHAMVNEVIGGCTTFFDWGHPEMFLSVMDWPDGRYEFKEVRIMCPHRGPRMRHANSSFVIDMKYIQRVFQQDFWDSLPNLAKLGDKHDYLIIPRTVGFSSPTTTREEYDKFSQLEKDEYRRKRNGKIIRTITDEGETDVLIDWQEPSETQQKGKEEGPSLWRRIFSST